MTKKIKRQLKTAIASFMIGALVMVATGSIIAQSNDLGNFLSNSELQFLLKMVLGSVEAPATAFGGSTTRGDWNVGGDLSITGSTTLTGNTAITGTITVSGETQAATVVSGGSNTQIGFGTTTATAAQVCNNSIISIVGASATQSVAALTLPATTTLNADCLGSNGKHKSFLFKNNATNTLAVTILAGAGIDLESDDNAGDIIAANASARLDFWRESDATTTVTISPFTNAD